MAASVFPASSLWASLAGGLSPVGNIPFVGLDGVTPVTDPTGIYYSQTGATFVDSQQAEQLTIAGGIRTDYVDTTNTSSATLTMNQTAGRFIIPAGQSQVTIDSTYCFENSIVHIQLEEADTTLTRAIASVVSDGVFVVQGNANATANCTVSFIIWNVRTPGQP